MKMLRKLIAFFFRLAVRVRHFCYDRKVISREFAGIPVISIGNLVAGGTGKTQLVLSLSKELRQFFRVAVVSRGYKGKAEESCEPINVDVTKHGPELCGDEPWLLASKLPDTSIIVCKERYRGALEAKKKGAHLVLLDDGMQHRRLYRDFEIVLLNASDPFGKGEFLPHGFLRDEPRRLAAADLVLIIGKVTSQLEKRLRTLTDAPYVCAKITGKKIRFLCGKELTSLKNVSVALFCGIANPHRFVETVEDLGGEVVATCYLNDHQKMEAEQLAHFCQLSKEKGAELILFTEKDNVKLETTDVSPYALPLAYVEVALEVTSNRDVWERALKNMMHLAGATI